MEPMVMPEPAMEGMLQEEGSDERGCHTGSSPSASEYGSIPGLLIMCMVWPGLGCLGGGGGGGCWVTGDSGVAALL